jgi:putative oxidoreductase
MNSFQKLEAWGQQHHKGWMDVLRIVFGLMLHLKGLYFMFHTWYIMKVIPYSASAEGSAVAVHVLAFLHILLGTLILIGVGTRMASLIMIPVILISLFFANPDFQNLFQIVYSVITIGLSVFYFIEGDGDFSVSKYMSHSSSGSQSPSNNTAEQE